MHSLVNPKAVPPAAKAPMQELPHSMAKALEAAISERARRAAFVRHEEHRQMRQQAIDWFKKHRHEFATKDKAAEVISKKIVPAKFATVRCWLRNV